MKRIRPVAMFLFLFVASVTIPAFTLSALESDDAQQGVDVLVDEAHGNIQYIPGEISFIASYLEEYGFHFKSIYNGHITQSLLSNSDILVLMFPSIAYTLEEISLIQAFVNNGGSILLVGTASVSFFKINNPSFTTNDNLNQIATLYGATFNNDLYTKILGPNDIPSNEFFYNTSSLVYNSGATLRLEGDPRSVLTSAGKILMAKNDASQGRIFLMGSVWPLNMPLDESLAHEADHYQLVLNIFTWLSRKEPATAIVELDLHEILATGPTLTEEQIDQYTLIRGSWHTHSQEGSTDSSTPASEMVEQARTLSFDYIVWADHDSDSPPWPGYAAASTYTQQKGYDLYNAPGVEVSQGFAHIVVYPVTEEWTSRSMRAIGLQDLLPLFEEIKNAGGLIIYAHPLMMEDTEHLYFRIKELGWSGMEVVNSGFQMGAGDIGAEYFNYTFAAGSDAHSKYSLSRTIQYLYVRNMTDAGLVDAMKNRRVLSYVAECNLWLGEKTWLDEFTERMSEASDFVASAKERVNPENPIAKALLQEAELSLLNSNPDRAKRYGQLALDAPNPTPTPPPTTPPPSTTTTTTMTTTTLAPTPTPTPHVPALTPGVAAFALAMVLTVQHRRTKKKPAD